MKRLLSVLLTLSLLAALSVSAGAWEYPGRKYPSFEEYLDFYSSSTDPDTQALARYIRDYLAERPDFLDTFDPDGYFEVNLANPGLGITKGNWFAWQLESYTEDHFRAEMLDEYLTRSYRAWRDEREARQKEARFQTLIQEQPEVYAAFDPYAWFDGYYGTAGAVLETYMYNWGLDEAGFKQTMFMEWADRSSTGFFNGYCVTVDGVPIQFQFYRDLEGEVTGPKADNDRLLIPLRAAAEALGFTVEWRPETGRVVCSNEEKTVTFTLDSTEYSGGTLDVAPYAEKGITYLPLRALGETLGCGVEWNQDFATAALTTGR